MSAWPARTIALAARLLPVAIRERHREEWLADLDGAAEAGVRGSGIALGALLFTLTLDRTAPELSGVPLSVTAQRHARWGIALLASAAALGFGSWFTGTGAPRTESWDALLGALSFTWKVLAVGALIVGLGSIWHAAAISTRMAKVAATLVTGVVATALLAITVPSALAVLTLTSMGLALGALVCGLIAWSAPTAPTAVALSSSRPRHPRLAVLAAGLAVLGLVAYGAVELVVLSPMWMAPGYSLAEIYAALSPADRTIGLVQISLWVLFWAAATLTLVVIGLVRARRLSRRAIVLATLGLVTAMVFFHFWAGFSIGNSISDALPPYGGGRSEFGTIYGMIGQAALVGLLIGAIAPLRRPRPNPAVGKTL